MAQSQTEQDNVAAVRRGYDAFAAGDMATLTDLFDANATWRSEASGILSGDYKNRDEIFAMFRQLHDETGGTFTSKPVAFAAAGERVFALSEAGGERNGQAASSPEILLFTLRDGRVRDVQLFVFYHEVAKTFWA